MHKVLSRKAITERKERTKQLIILAKPAGNRLSNLSNLYLDLNHVGLVLTIKKPLNRSHQSGARQPACSKK